MKINKLMIMKRSIFYILLSVLSVLNISAQDKTVHVIKVGDFNELRLTDNINVIYSYNVDSIGIARFECTQTIADKLMFTNNTKGKLTIQVATEAVGSKDLPLVYIYSNFLQSVDNASDSVIKIMNIAPVPSVKLKLSSNGKIIAHNIEGTTVEAQIMTGKGSIIVDGKCTTASLRNLGTGEIQADKLIAEDVNCNLTGTGTIGCYASNILSIKGIGTGKVYYLGNPKEIKTFKLGSIKAIPLDPK